MDHSTTVSPALDTQPCPVCGASGRIARHPGAVRLANLAAWSKLFRWDQRGGAA